MTAHGSAITFNSGLWIPGSPTRHGERREFWLNTDRPADDAHVYWIGAGTKDTGFSLTQLTFQITHATNSNTNAERDFIIADLRNNQVISDVNKVPAGQRIEHINHYVTDGEIALADLSVAGS